MLAELVRLGFAWAYRVVSARAFRAFSCETFDGGRAFLRETRTRRLRCLAVPVELDRRV